MAIAELAGLCTEFKTDTSAKATALIHSQPPGLARDDKVEPGAKPQERFLKDAATIHAEAANTRFTTSSDH
jgi:hypothetical protein